MAVNGFECSAWGIEVIGNAWVGYWLIIVLTIVLPKDRIRPSEFVNKAA